MTNKKEIAEETQVNGYLLSRQWFDFAFENQGKVSGNHGCMYMWFIEQGNRFGWPEQFGVPRDQTMAAVGITSQTTYKKVLTDLISWGFVKMVKESKNQFSANIIALPKNDKAPLKALDKALLKQVVERCSEQVLEHCTGTSHGTGAINKPLTTNIVVVKEEENFAEKIEEKISEVEIIETDEILDEIPVNDKISIDEEKYSAIVEYLENQSLFQITQSQQKITGTEVTDYFRFFYEQKFALKELRHENQDELLRNFYFWLPIHIRSKGKKVIKMASASDQGKGSAAAIEMFELLKK